MLQAHTFKKLKLSDYTHLKDITILQDYQNR